MRKLITTARVIAVVAAAGAATLGGCRQAVQSTNTVIGPTAAEGAGAPDAVSAVRAFMDAAGQSDLRAMSAVFGTADGPASASIPRRELEAREAIMICHVKHDKYDVVADAPEPGGGRKLVVQITYHDLTRTSDFLAVRGPAERWYVESIDLQPLEDICKRRG